MSLSIKTLQDKHVNHPCFIAGAGPSLHFVDVEPLKDFVTITVNSSLLKMPWCTYFLSDDIGVQHWNYYLKLLPKTNCIKLLFEDKLKNNVGHLKDDDIIWFKHKCWYDPKQKQKHMDGLIMTKDATKPIIGARTSLASAIHFAYIMGCNPIVLLGCDCCYYQNKRYFWQFPGELKAFRMNGERVFSRPNKGKVQTRPVDSHCLDFIKYWNEFADMNKNLSVEIIDVSGGLLNCFHKMDYDDVLEKFII